VQKIKKMKKYTKYSKRDGKHTKFQILASSTVARLHKKFGTKNPKKKVCREPWLRLSVKKNSLPRA
jgi:hypothetical protein